MNAVSFFVVANQDRVDVEVGLIFPLVGFYKTRPSSGPFVRGPRTNG